jgi:hypothetical protein
MHNLQISGENNIVVNEQEGIGEQSSSSSASASNRDKKERQG